MQYKLDPVKNQKTEKYENCYIRNLSINDSNQIMFLQNKIIIILSDPDLFSPFNENELVYLFEHEENIILGVFTESDKLIAFRAATASGKEFDEINHFLDEKYKNTKKMLLNGAFVDEDYRGNKLQVKMSEYTIKIARIRNYKMLFTVIHPQNAASIKSITSLGFEEIKEIKVYEKQHKRLLFIKEII